MSIPITEQQKAELNPMLTKEVHHNFEVEGELMPFFKADPISGTDTLRDRVVGGAKVERIDWTEVDKHAQKGAFGTITYTLEEAIYIRHAEKDITAFIQDINGMKEFALEHAKDLSIQREVTILTALLRGARMGAMEKDTTAGIADENNLDKAITAGHRAILDNAGDELDSSKLYAKMGRLWVSMNATRKLNKMTSLWAVSLMTYQTLLEDEKLVSGDFSQGNGDVARNVLRRVYDLPVLPIKAFQDLQSYVGVTNPIGNTWTTDKVDATARAVLFTPRAIKVFEAQPVTSGAHYSEDHMVNYITSRAYYGVGVRRQDHIGALFIEKAKNSSTDDAVGVGTLAITENVGSTDVTIV